MPRWTFVYKQQIVKKWNLLKEIVVFSNNKFDKLSSGNWCYSTFFLKLFTKLTWCYPVFALAHHIFDRNYLCSCLCSMFFGTFFKNTKFLRFRPTFHSYNCILKSTERIVRLLRFKPINHFFKAIGFGKMEILIRILSLLKQSG